MIWHKLWLGLHFRYYKKWNNIEYKNKELWIKYLLEDIETKNTKKIADIVLNEAIDNNFGKIKDDMSVIACKFIQKDM